MHEAKPVDMSSKASSVMLETKPAHASEAHVAVVRGVPPPLPSPHEDSSPNLAIAPMHVLSGGAGQEAPLLWQAVQAAHAGLEASAGPSHVPTGQHA